MFRPLLSHPQEVLQSGTWYIAYLLCQLAAPGLEWNETDIIRTQYTKFRLCNTS
jgi:hypothetical protein